MRGRRALLAILVPLAFTLAVFVGAWRMPQSSGAGFTDQDRPWGFAVLAVVAGVGWVYGTSMMFAMVAPPGALPPRLRSDAIGFVRPELHPSDSASEDGAVHAIPARRLIGIVVWQIPVFLFLAPLLLGFLVQGGVYDLVEAAAVTAMGVATIAWSVFLLRRVRTASMTNAASLHEHDGHT